MNEQRLYDLFCNLCKINAPPLKERDVVDWGKEYLAQMGLEVWEDDAASRIGGNANNVIAVLPATKPGARAIFLSAHWDTVEPTAGLEIEERHGVYYSKSDTILGADDKAGMAPAIEAVHHFVESEEPHGAVYLVLCVAEEIGLKGAFACDIAALGVDFGYVFDTGPPVGTFVNRVGTHDRLNARVIGKPAHAGKDPEHGINAIQAAAKGLSTMKLGRIDEQTTANAGIIQGGTGVNVVPAECVVRCEARSLDTAKLEAQIAHMRERFEAGASEMGANVDFEHKRAYSGYHIPETEPVVTLAVEAAKQLGYSGDLRWTLGGSDANAFNEKGVPSIVCGTGMKEIHTHNEHVSKEDLVGLTNLAIELIRGAAQ